MILLSGTEEVSLCEQASPPSAGWQSVEYRVLAAMQHASTVSFARALGRIRMVVACSPPKSECLQIPTCRAISLLHVDSLPAWKHSRISQIAHVDAGYGLRKSRRRSEKVL